MNDVKKQILEMLQNSRVAEIYKTTYESIINRTYDDGYFPESLKDGYGNHEFPRTIGGLEALLSETGEFALMEKVLGYTLNASKEAGVNRIPHMLAPTPKNGEKRFFSIDDEVDGTLHVLGAYARLGAAGNLTKEFEDEWYPYIRYLLNIVCDMPYFYYNSQQPVHLYPNAYPPETMQIVYNCAFEHSREGRRWCCFDLLTQCFFGGTLEAMAKLAKKRGETEDAEFYSKTIELLREGVDKYMTRESENGKVYLEMRLPDGAYGKPFTEMGWVNLSPTAARWQPLPQSVYDNTVKTLVERLWRPVINHEDLYILYTDTTPGSEPKPDTIGKGLGWYILYCLDSGNFEHILSVLKFIDRLNDGPLYNEAMHLNDGILKAADPGNGEQCVWWCWAMAVLRKSFGLTPAP